MLHRHSALLGKLMRYAGVGILVTGSYSIVAYAAIKWGGFAPFWASLIACAVAITGSYLGQKYFTFRSNERHKTEMPKFLVTSTLATFASTGCITLLTNAGVDYRAAILLAATVVPLCNFMVMNLWVFAAADGRPL